MANPWDKRDGETAKAYQAFQFYLEERDKTQFAAYLDYCEWNWDRGRKEDEKDTRNDPPAWFKRWPSKHDWSDRRGAFYADVDKQALADLKGSKARRKVERVQMLDDVRSELEVLIPELHQMALEQGVSLRDFVNALDKVMKNYREELDDKATERIEHTGEGGGPVEQTLTLTGEDAADVAETLERAGVTRSPEGGNVDDDDSD